MGWPLLLIGYVAIITTPSVIGYEVMSEDSDYSNGNSKTLQNWEQPSYTQPLDWDSNDLAREVTKRALSVLSRWRPLTNALQRSSFPRIESPPRRFSNRSPTMLRPIGQPLRWGRRR